MSDNLKDDLIWQNYEQAWNGYGEGKSLCVCNVGNAEGKINARELRIDGMTYVVVVYDSEYSLRL